MSHTCICIGGNFDKYINGSQLSVPRCINGVGFEMLGQTSVTKMTPSYPRALHSNGQYRSPDYQTSLSQLVFWFKSSILIFTTAAVLDFQSEWF